MLQIKAALIAWLSLAVIYWSLSKHISIGTHLHVPHRCQSSDCWEQGVCSSANPRAQLLWVAVNISGCECELITTKVCIQNGWKWNDNVKKSSRDPHSTEQASTFQLISFDWAICLCKSSSTVLLTNHQELALADMSKIHVLSLYHLGPCHLWFWGWGLNSYFAASLCLPLFQHLLWTLKEFKLHTDYSGVSEQMKP